MLRLFGYVALLVLGLNSALAADGDVEFVTRLQPSRDIVAELVSEGSTTMRVLEDRGIVASSNGRLSLIPQTFQVTARQSVRYITSDRLDDGGFSVEARSLGKTTTMRGPDGMEKTLPANTWLKNFGFRVTMNADGGLRENTLQILGVEDAKMDQFRPFVSGLLAQFSSMPPLVLSPGKSVPQEMSIQMPVPGLTTLALKMTNLFELIHVEDGIARINLLTRADLGFEPKGLKAVGGGKGAGIMFYDTRARTLVSSETKTKMNFVFDTPEGVVELRMDTTDKILMRPAG